MSIPEIEAFGMRGYEEDICKGQYDAALGAVGICAAGLLVLMGLAKYEEAVGESRLTLYLEAKDFEQSHAELRASGALRY
jgi:hypothetical protein